MVYIAKLKDGLSLAFNTEAEIKIFEFRWRHPRQNTPDLKCSFFAHMEALFLADRQRDRTRASFDDYVTVFTLPDELIQPPKPKRQPAGRKVASPTPAPV